MEILSHAWGGGGGGGAYVITDFKSGIFTGHFPVTLQQWKE